MDSIDRDVAARHLAAMRLLQRADRWNRFKNSARCRNPVAVHAREMKLRAQAYELEQQIESEAQTVIVEALTAYQSGLKSAALTTFTRDTLVCAVASRRPARRSTPRGFRSRRTRTRRAPSSKDPDEPEPPLGRLLALVPRLWGRA